MYNHYIPQSDGSYRRSAHSESRRAAPPQKSRPEPPCPQPEQPKNAPCPSEPTKNIPCPPEQPPQAGNILDFLRGLLPRSIDTADLMIVFLLLLMNKDDEGGLSPILTLAMYFLL